MGARATPGSSHQQPEQRGGAETGRVAYDWRLGGATAPSVQRSKITSSKNPFVRRFRKAGGGEPPEVMAVEGVRLVWEGLKEDVQVLEAVFSPRLQRNPLGRELLEKLEQVSPAVTECTDEVLDRMSAVTTHQGVVAIFRRPSVRLEDLLGGDEATLLVIAAGMRDPGNLGALLRTADASGATGVMSLAGGADPYRDKAVRGSAGSVFRLPTLGGVSVDEAIGLVRSKGLQLVVADRVADDVYDKVDYRPPTALVLGAETGGIPQQLKDAATHRVRIPMRTGVESLNVAVAAGVLLYEARRQR